MPETVSFFHLHARHWWGISQPYSSGASLGVGRIKNIFVFFTPYFYKILRSRGVGINIMPGFDDINTVFLFGTTNIIGHLMGLNRIQQTDTVLFGSNSAGYCQPGFAVFAGNIEFFAFPNVVIQERRIEPYHRNGCFVAHCVIQTSFFKFKDNLVFFQNCLDDLNLVL